MKNFQNVNLSDFVSVKTKLFFDKFGLSSDFLNKDPSTWETIVQFDENWTFCRDLMVVNDVAERGIKFVQDYNQILTRDEEEYQLILQVCEWYRKMYPSHKKSDLTC